MPNDSSSHPDHSAADPDIGRLKERLSFYESFDQLIQDNVSQASHLLREAADLRENAAVDASSAKHQFEEERTNERERYRALFSMMLDEITSLQGQAERLARRLTDAIDVLEAELRPGAEFPHLASSLSPELDVRDELRDADDRAPGDAFPAGSMDDSLLAGQPDTAALGTGPAPSGVKVEDELEQPGPHASSQPASNIDDAMLVEVKAVESPPGSQEVDAKSPPVPGLDDTLADVSVESIPRPISVEKRQDVEPAPESPVAESLFVLLVHGVPRAAAALSLKRYLETLEQVQSVEPREFAAGVLRLQLRVARDLTAHDLKQWAGHSSGITTIHSRTGLLEIQLNP